MTDPSTGTKDPGQLSGHGLGRGCVKLGGVREQRRPMLDVEVAGAQAARATLYVMVVVDV
jgi:hypothetical protein